MKPKKSLGLFFSIDALIAASIIFIAIILSFYAHQKTEKPISILSHLSGDLALSLAEIRISELNNSYITSLINDGYITKLNNTILEQIGELWGERNLEQAKNLSEQFVKSLPGRYGYGIYVDGEVIIENTTIPINILSTEQKIISGIQKNRSTEGYVAKAYVTKAKKNNTLIVKGDVITSSVRKSPSGNNGNLINVTYNFYIPENATILGSYWFIEAAWTDTKFKAFLNGDFIPGSSATGSKLLTDLNSYLNVGNNTATVEYRYGSGGDEGGDDGATHLVVNYSTNQLLTLSGSDKRYFGLVNSNASIRYKLPIFVVGQINSMDINLNVVARNVSMNYTLDGKTYNISFKNVVGNNVQWSNTEILNALSQNNYTYSNLSNKYFWLQVDLEEYHSRENFGTQRAFLQDSYVEIDFTLAVEVFKRIDITSVVDKYKFNTSQLGDFYRNVEWRFDINNATTPINFDSQLAWYYLTGKDPSQTVKSNSEILYQHPPNPLIIEFTRFGYAKEHIANGTNAYTLNFGSGYGVNPINSLVSTSVLIPISVDYADTFGTLSSAIDDANNRLNVLLGNFVSATEISNDVITLSKVPSMWGPVIVEIRVWK